MHECFCVFAVFDVPYSFHQASILYFYLVLGCWVNSYVPLTYRLLFLDIENFGLHGLTLSIYSCDRMLFNDLRCFR